ncbi:hypothetical protein ACTFIU_002800 [Dictyostelium citrinum]
MINIKDEVTSKLRDDLLKSINKDTERLIFSNGFFIVLTDSKPTVIKIMNLFDSQMKGLHSATIRPKNCFTNFEWKYSIEMVEETLAKNENPITENSEVNKEPTTNTQPQQKPKKQTAPKKEKPNKEPTTTSNENQNEQLNLSPATSEIKDKPTTTIHDEKLVTKTTESNSLEFLNISAINEFKEESRIVESSPTIESIDNQSLLNIIVKVETPTIQAPLIQPTNIHKPEFLPQWNLETSTTQIKKNKTTNINNLFTNKITHHATAKTNGQGVSQIIINKQITTITQIINERLMTKNATHTSK